MVTMAKELARVESVFLGIEDHGIFTMVLHLDFGGSHIGFGGFFLGHRPEGEDRARGTAAGADFICAMLDLFGVDDIKKLVGRTCFVLHEKSIVSATDIIGLELPAFDGGKRFITDEWRADCARKGIT